VSAAAVLAGVGKAEGLAGAARVEDLVGAVEGEDLVAVEVVGVVSMRAPRTVWWRLASSCTPVKERLSASLPTKRQGT
jgi:hypothetical protein